MGYDTDRCIRLYIMWGVGHDIDRCIKYIRLYDVGITLVGELNRCIKTIHHVGCRA